ncbi:hypothetical protein NW752_011579 [Fusarium irregulare]|uniref:Uncharacterized protein n=1 Tax=Fusarium irregulare TaxID=2494466 RepID=A0A9W8PPM3_9HYPO|nr:hypothetical protein NW752_011579 [Fusarium irregulare]KAJ4013704.1 hypothetical protein NW766_005943 [Fusarium irregulare]
MLHARDLEKKQVADQAIIFRPSLIITPVNSLPWYASLFTGESSLWVQDPIHRIEHDIRMRAVGYQPAHRAASDGWTDCADLDVLRSIIVTWRWTWDLDVQKSTLEATHTPRLLTLPHGRLDVNLDTADTRNQSLLSMTSKWHAHRMQYPNSRGFQHRSILRHIELSDKDMSCIKLNIVDNAQGDEADFVIYDMVTTLELLLLVFPCC